MNREVFKRSNPHPEGKNRGDCIIRALVHAFDEDYKEMRKKVNRKKREYGFEKYNNPEFFPKLMKDLGYERLIIKVKPNTPRLRAETFIKEYGKGTFIVKMAAHVACIKDGYLLDSWNSSDKAIYTAWRIS